MLDRLRCLLGMHEFTWLDVSEWPHYRAVCARCGARSEFQTFRSALFFPEESLRIRDMLAAHPSMVDAERVIGKEGE